MKLKTVNITEFQSIQHASFDVDEITCLVGKNEAGKTAILKALYRLSPLIETEGEFSATDDYPRRDVEDYRLAVESGEREHARVVDATFTVEDADIEEAQEQFGPGLFTNRTLRLWKGYDNRRGRTALSLDGAQALRYFLAKRQFAPDVKAALDNVATPEQVGEVLASVEQTVAVKEVQELLQKIATAKTLENYVYQTYVHPRTPKFLYFDEYYQMEGHANIEALRGRQLQSTLKNSDRPLLGLIGLARLSLEELLNHARTRELKNKLEAAGNHLTKKIVSYWSQNRHLRLGFDVRPGRPQDPPGMTTGTNIWGDVEDTKHRVTTELGTRSKGFVWFFSFLAWYSEQKRKERNLILLLDEPGLSLHGRAQGDLLRYFEAEIKGVHQLIYTTHSPFMVDSGHFERVRIVQDLTIDSDADLPTEKRGTKVTTDVLEATGDTLFPLQGALGYDLYQTLFVGPNSLVVEGVSDLLYLQVMSAVLERKGRTGLSRDWTITPVGGADKVPTFVALIGSKKQLNVAVLVDFQKKDRQTIENLWKRKLLAKEKVVTFAEFVTADEADIEDLFEPEFYLELVGLEYGLAKGLALSRLPKHPRILLRLEQYFETNPPQGSAFNHYRPARCLSDRIASLEASLTAATLDRFEKAFERVNALLRQ